MQENDNSSLQQDGTEARQSPLKSLEKDLRYYEESIKEIAQDILANKISRFPVFVAHQHEAAIGQPILDKEDLGTDWTINASTLEEFIEKKVILPNKREYFELNYKSPAEFMCLFVVVPEGANFVFYPYH